MTLKVDLEFAVFRGALPPNMSGCPDFGPDPDFFGQSGPDLVRILLKSPDFSQNYEKNAENATV